MTGRYVTKEKTERGDEGISMQSWRHAFQAAA